MQPGVGPVYDALTREPLGPCADRLGGRDEATGEAGWSTRPRTEGNLPRRRRKSRRGGRQAEARGGDRASTTGNGCAGGPVPRAVHEPGAYGRLGKPGPAYPAGFRPRGASAPQRGVIPHGDGPRRGRERPGGSKPSGLKTAFEKQGGASPGDRSKGGTLRRIPKGGVPGPWTRFHGADGPPKRPSTVRSQAAAVCGSPCLYPPDTLWGRGVRSVQALRVEIVVDAGGTPERRCGMRIAAFLSSPRPSRPRRERPPNTRRVFRRGWPDQGPGALAPGSRAT